MHIERDGENVIVNGAILDHFCIHKVLRQLIEPDVILNTRMHLYSSQADLDNFKNFGAIFESNKKGNSYYGYIPTGTRAIIIPYNTTFSIKRNDIEIFDQQLNYKHADYVVIPTDTGKIFFKFAEKYPHLTFDNLVDTIRQKAESLGINFDLDYETFNDRKTARLSKMSKNTN